MLGSVIAFVLPGIASLIGGVTLLSAAQALRAKERLKQRIQEEVSTDERLRQILRSARDRLQTDEDLSEMKELSAELERLAHGMSDTDRRAVEQSLHQRSKAGERRYIREMLSAV